MLSREHLRSRLVCLNKVYPAIPQIQEYRPIVIASSVIKYLEGYLTPTLKKVALSFLHPWQMGFVPGAGIETCKADVITKAN